MSGSEVQLWVPAGAHWICQVHWIGIGAPLLLKALSPPGNVTSTDSSSASGPLVCVIHPESEGALSSSVVESTMLKSCSATEPGYRREGASSVKPARNSHSISL